MLCQLFQGRPAIVGFAAIALVLAAAGCSTAPSAGQAAPPVKEGKNLPSDLTEPSPERSATVSFLRDKSSLDATCTYKILVNGRVAFSIGNGGNQTIHLAPGQYSIGMESGRGACPNIAISQSTAVSPGGEMIFRIFSPNRYGAQLIRIK
jgi:hypothetical protein